VKVSRGGGLGVEVEVAGMAVKVDVSRGATIVDVFDDETSGTNV
jgi:hypothetical protein